MSKKVGFQGEIGAYSEEAVRALVADAEAVALPSFHAVFRGVHESTLDLGVIPIENSLHGSVHENYDLLRANDLRIVGELQLRVRHQLLAVPGATREGITAVYSHPQAIGQCGEFLRVHLPDAVVVASYDTAGAAKMVAEENNPGYAAIASARAGVRYRLEPLADSIESNHKNYTRFLALARPDRTTENVIEFGEGSELKTSIVYAQKENVPGSLFKSLAVFALRDIDLYKIESRPLVGSPGSYLFYLDMAGSADDDSITNALHHLGEVAASVKVLGTYHSGRIVE